MNDTELDELLDRWRVPPASAELRGKTWRAFRPPRQPFLIPFRPMFAGTALGAGLCVLLLITQAFPQTIGFAPALFRVPFTVDSEFVSYDAQGKSNVEVYTTSYLDDNGREAILTASFPGRPFGNAVRRILDFTSFVWRQYAEQPIRGLARPISFADCMPSGPVIEWTSILGHRSFVIDITPPAVDKHRVTLWEASDLCFVMKIRNEERRPDGSYRVISERHALAIRRTGGQQSSR